MPAFNFLSRFAPAVEAGQKRQTVRAHRRHDPRPGQTAYLYTGMRTAACRLLATKRIMRVETVYIDRDGQIDFCCAIGEDGGIEFGTARADLWVPLIESAADAFARADGFENAEAFVGWIARTHGLPFEGTVTYW